MKKTLIVLTVLLIAAMTVPGVLSLFPKGGQAYENLGQAPQLEMPSAKALGEVQTATPVNQIEFIDGGYESPKAEMRAAWVATVTNIDMPKAMDEIAFRNWANEVCSNLKERNFNTIIFQVKPLSDALYQSNLSPWSQYITGGAQGTDPGYDPLAIMVDTAHSYGLELHAWINPYRVTMANGKLEDLSPDNIAKKAPGWVLKYGTQYYLNPGIPDVRTYLLSCVRELVQNYDIDAVHMDDYFYPYAIAGQSYPDDYTFQVYGNGFANKNDWRRNNVNLLVSEINRTIKEVKPYVQFGISPFGIWRNASVDPTGSDTKGGQTNYDTLYADCRQWLKDGSIDYLTPQLYWSRQHNLGNYTTLLAWWDKEFATYAEQHPVNLYIGMGDYRVGNGGSDAPYNLQGEIPGEITDNRLAANVKGQMHYSYRSIINNALGYMDVLVQTHYKNMALHPPTPWNEIEAVKAPTHLTGDTTAKGVLLTIKDDNNQQDVRKYVIYRSEAGQYLDFNNPANIIGVIYKNKGSQFTDTSAIKGSNYTYGVRSLSGSNVESTDGLTIQHLY